MMILDLVIENLKAEGLLQTAPRTHVALAYSGGGDSTALLFLLKEIQSRYPLDITAIYFNHGWRGRPANELALLHRNCSKCDIPLIVVQADRTLPKTENAARQARYKALTSAAHDLRADALLTAHHADDQIETLLFRVLRGTGLDGLAGIHRRLELELPAGKPVPILRPLLDVSRKRLNEYVVNQRLEVFHDPSNDDVRLQRNNIRHRVLPALEESFPQVKNALFRLSLVADGDIRILEEAVGRVWKDVYGKDDQGSYLEALSFNQLAQAYQRRIIKRFFSVQNIHSDFQMIEDVLAFIRGEERHNMDAALKSLIRDDSGTTRFLSLYKGRLRIIATTEEHHARPPVISVPVSVPGHVQIETERKTFTALPWRAPEKVMMSPIRPNDTQQVYIDFTSYLDKPLELRTRQPGDRFQPMGMDVAIRFKKFLINRGVPRFERNKLLVLACGNQILWAPGLGISQQVRLKPKARPTHLLRLQSGLHPEPVELTEPFIPEPEQPERDERESDSTDSDDTNDNTKPFAAVAAAPMGFDRDELDSDDLIMEDDDE